jgi:serine-type D-Ala-D-Ala carboxypeptidase/endopeptidase (penicillin-binding protein 4)
MKKIVFVFLLCFSFPCFSNIDLVFDNLVKKTGISKKNLGVYFFDLDKNKKIYSLNENKNFKIASVTKLFLTAYILENIDKGYRFKTPVFADIKSFKKGVLKGDLYIKGSGDPVFVYESLWRLVQNLRNFKIKEILGNIILDDSSFYFKSLYNKKTDRSYGAKISSLSLNFNSIAINIVSGKNPSITLEPNLSYFKIVDKTKKTSNPTKVYVKRKNKAFIINGNINNKDISYKVLYRNVEDPFLYFKETLKKELKERGIILKGNILKDKLKGNKNFLFNVKTRRIETILQDMNRFSTNFIAEQIINALSDEGIDSLNKYMHSKGYRNFNFVNASGFSNNNFATPKVTVNFLEMVFLNQKIRPEFLTSLSVSGEDGTIKNILKKLDLKGKIRAKTGTLNGVKTIAGYFFYKGRNIAFAIFVNDSNANKIISWEEKLFLSII